MNGILKSIVLKTQFIVNTSVIISLVTMLSCQPSKDSGKTDAKDKASEEPIKDTEQPITKRSQDAPKDWNAFESIFFARNSEVNQKLGVNVLEGDSIEFRLFTKDLLCDTDYWGFARNLNAGMDPEMDEDEDSEGYMADEFINKDDDRVLKIRIADTRDRARIIFAYKTNENVDMECIPAEGLLLKKE